MVLFVVNVDRITSLYCGTDSHDDPLLNILIIGFCLLQSMPPTVLPEFQQKQYHTLRELSRKKAVPKALVRFLRFPLPTFVSARSITPSLIISTIYRCSVLLGMQGVERAVQHLVYLCS